MKQTILLMAVMMCLLVSITSAGNLTEAERQRNNEMISRQFNETSNFNSTNQISTNQSSTTFKPDWFVIIIVGVLAGLLLAYFLYWLTQSSDFR